MSKLLSFRTTMLSRTRLTGRDLICVSVRRLLSVNSAAMLLFKTCVSVRMPVVRLLMTSMAVCCALVTVALSFELTLLSTVRFL